MASALPDVNFNDKSFSLVSFSDKSPGLADIHFFPHESGTAHSTYLFRWFITTAAFILTIFCQGAGRTVPTCREPTTRSEHHTVRLRFFKLLETPCVYGTTCGLVPDLFFSGLYSPSSLFSEFSTTSSETEVGNPAFTRRCTCRLKLSPIKWRHNFSRGAARRQDDAMSCWASGVVRQWFLRSSKIKKKKKN